MKSLIYSVLLIGLFLFAAASKSQAETYLGEFCWQLDISTAGASATMKVGMYAKEGGHYAFYGKVLDNNITVNGNAEVDGSNVLMTFVLSGIGAGSGDKSGEIGNAVLDASTLSGTFYWVGVNYPPAGDLGNHYDYGTMTKTFCP